jgi:hypothetical protein
MNVLSPDKRLFRKVRTLTVETRHAAARVDVGTAREDLWYQSCNQLTLLDVVGEVPNSVALGEFWTYFLRANAPL